MNKKSKHHEVFLDCGETIIEYIDSIDKSILIKFSLSTIIKYKKRKKDYLLFVPKRQSGISKGITAERAMVRYNSCVDKNISSNNITTIDKTYYCPHTIGDNCSNMLNPGFKVRINMFSNICSPA